MVYLEISQNSQENTCVRDSFLIKLSLWRRCFPLNFAKLLACNFIEKEPLEQVFFCEFSEISRNTFFTEHHRTTASESS